jgi:hypothetical protein
MAEDVMDIARKSGIKVAQFCTVEEWLGFYRKFFGMEIEPKRNCNNSYAK